MHAVELAGNAPELSLAVFIERDSGFFAAINGNHININAPQRNVINRFELALDLQNSV
ncbi:hypothetical protein D3C84_660290 [compost metagenome]